MSKSLNIEKYGLAVHHALTDLNKRKATKVAWTEFSTGHGISNNLGSVLLRTGLVSKNKNGEYKSNIATSRISKAKAVAIAEVIKEHKLIQFPNNQQAINAAKTKLTQLNIVKAEKANPLAVFSTKDLIAELKNRGV
jgi:hypothetical protein